MLGVRAVSVCSKAAARHWGAIARATAAAEVSGTTHTYSHTHTHSRTYVATTVPAITIADVNTFASKKRTRVTHSGAKALYQRNESDHAAYTEARVRGFLSLTHGCSPTLLNSYLKYCCDARRPYMVLSRDGATLTVDLEPVRGVVKAAAGGPAPRQQALDAVTDAVKGVLRAAKGVQVSKRDTLQKQIGSILAGPKEGRDAAKVRDTVDAIGGMFTCYTESRGAARDLAAALYSAYAGATGGTTVEAWLAGREAEHARRAEAKTDRTLRKLRKLTGNALAMKNLRVKAGALDGFIAADRSGKVEEMLAARAASRPASPAAAASSASAKAASA